ncbi:MAG: isoleucine--tRNA ligase [Candidatus Micrarchaeia archaeon]
MQNLVDIEKAMLGFWKKEGIYEKVKKAGKGRPRYYFCDGPPYATGQIHPGTAWNKCIKDSICRYKRAAGFDVRAQPGFDTHGLPIEVKVEQVLKLGSKKDIEVLGITNFIEKCKAFATEHIGVMSGQFQRVGVWMDFDRPYITYHDDYIEKSWATIKVAHEKGLLTRGVSVLPYCHRCETTLANYELEYGEQQDPSIYVKFKLVDSDEYLVIWTTTPWTLVSNMAVMAHPTFTYVKAKVGDETWILAKDRLDSVMAFEFGKSAVVLSEMSGKRLEGLKYLHPLQGKLGKNAERKVVLSDEYVTLEDGSGLVHCAPGHGPEDFIIGKRFDIEVYSPVDTQGRFKPEAGAYAGMKVREASKNVIEDLHACGALIHEGKIQHRYPHCWRCKNPLIFMTTDQWFISITKLKDKMLDEIEKVSWKPDFAKTRFRDFVQAAPDWCISRQRYWGIPLPIWVSEKDQSKIIVLGSRDKLPKKVPELHRPYVDEIVMTDEAGEKYRRVPDILDVWFDSGNAIWASLSNGEPQTYPADFIVEGKDQTRGWFYSLLGSGLVLHSASPYKNLLMHGFFVDEKGEKMSKSVGNFVPLEEVVDKYGADTFRLWSLSGTVWDDLKFNWDEIKEASRSLNIYYNMFVFLQRFYQSEAKPEDVSKLQLEIEDRWILSRLNSTAKECTDAFDSYEPHKAAKAVRRFIVEDLSRTYLKLAKKRVSEGRSPQSALAVFYHVMLETCKLSSPVIPFISEHIFQEFFRKYEGGESVSLSAYPKPNPRMIDVPLEKHFEIAMTVATASVAARQAANVKLRWPLEVVHVVAESTDVQMAVEKTAPIIETMANVQKIVLGMQGLKPTYSKKIHHSRIGAKYKEKSKEALEAAQSADATALLQAYAKDGKMESDGIELTPELVEVEESVEHFSIYHFDGGKVYLKTALDKKLYAQAMVREASRRVQLMRKELSLVESDKVKVSCEADSELEKILKDSLDEFLRQVNASEVAFEKAEKGAKEWEIEDFTLKLSIKKTG